MNIVFGVAGFAKEIDWLINDMQLAGKADYRTDLYVCEPGNALAGATLHGTPVLDEHELYLQYAGRSDLDCFLGIGSPHARQRVVAALRRWNPACRFPTLVHPSVSLDTRPGRITLGDGAVICAGTIMTTEIEIGEFVHVNIDCTVGHDSRIGAFTTISPGVHVSGNVRMGQRAFIGTGANLIEHVTLAADVVVGAGGCVTRSLEEPGTYVGVPVKKVK